MCFTGIVYSREIDGETYTFGVSGRLIRNTLVMFDRETDSLWGQIIGEAVDGPLKGTKLEFVPSILTTWGDWKAKNPGTLALVKGFYGSNGSYQGYYRSGQAGVIGETYQDDRLYAKEFVIGVEYKGHAAAYPFSELNRQPVINDELGDLPILVVFNPNSAAGAVFSRIVEDGSILTFTISNDSLLVDNQTGTTWDRFTGLALEGPLAGSQLQAVKYTAAFWFGWKDWYPGTTVYGE